MSVTADHNQETSVDYLPPLSPYAYQPMTRRQPGKRWKILEVFTPLHFHLVTDMGRYYVNGSRAWLMQLHRMLQTAVGTVGYDIRHFTFTSLPKSLFLCHTHGLILISS